MATFRVDFQVKILNECRYERQTFDAAYVCSFLEQIHFEVRAFSTGFGKQHMLLLCRFRLLKLFSSEVRASHIMNLSKQYLWSTVGASQIKRFIKQALFVF
jgi:hypothetical protein